MQIDQRPLSASQNYNLSQVDRDDRFNSFTQQVLPSLGQQIGTLAGQYGRQAAAQGASRVLGTAGTTASYLGTATGIAGAMYGAYDIIASWGRSTPAQGAASGMAVGATIGSFIAPGLGTAVGAAIGTLVGGVVGFVRAGKHPDQEMRDGVRDFLRQNGAIDNNYCVTLVDGSKYDIGKDGGPRAEFGGRRPFEIDFNNPLAKYAVSWINPLINVIAGKNQKITSDFVGYLANAAMSNAKSLGDVRNNVAAIMSQFGVTDQGLAKAVVQAVQQGVIPEQVGQIYLHGIEERRRV
jgi:hypothetical protein